LRSAGGGGGDLKLDMGREWLEAEKLATEVIGLLLTVLLRIRRAEVDKGH
jgi:hypothetical protein